MAYPHTSEHPSYGNDQIKPLIVEDPEEGKDAEATPER